MIRMKNVHSSKMSTFSNISIKLDNNSEQDAIIFMFGKKLEVHFTHNRSLSWVLYKKELILNEGGPPDTLVFEHVSKIGDNLVIRVRFASAQAKTAFLESVFAPRNEDSGNSSEPSSDFSSSSASE